MYISLVGSEKRNRYVHSGSNHRYFGRWRHLFMKWLKMCEKDSLKVWLLLWQFPKSLRLSSSFRVNLYLCFDKSLIWIFPPAERGASATSGDLFWFLASSAVQFSSGIFSCARKEIFRNGHVGLRDGSNGISSSPSGVQCSDDLIEWYLVVICWVFVPAFLK